MQRRSSRSSNVSVPSAGGGQGAFKHAVLEDRRELQYDASGLQVLLSFFPILLLVALSCYPLCYVCLREFVEHIIALCRQEQHWAKLTLRVYLYEYKSNVGLAVVA